MPSIVIPIYFEGPSDPAEPAGNQGQNTGVSLDFEIG